MIEIERKFTVDGDFMPEVAYSQRITQGYICADEDRTVRVRMAGDKAFITIKGPSDKDMWSRYEFERQIDLCDATELMKLCRAGVVDKVRHYIPRGKHTWEVDVFHGDNEGLFIAEIELASRDEAFDLPHWAGREVTSDARYYNAALARRPYSQWDNNNNQHKT
jgi:CYTH domain-containing protein